MKTIALTCILKNELRNLPEFCKSFSGLFQEYFFTDTGSTDGSKEWLEKNAYTYLGVPESNVHILHFTWIDDFAAARNFALSEITTDYWMWVDLDDRIHNREAFEAFLREPIGMHDMWYAPYNYSLQPDGTPALSFVRERVFKTKLGYRFQDPIHEGVDVRKVPTGNNMVTAAWAIDHVRTHEEMEGDRVEGRNIRILEREKKAGNLSERLRFYLGKEYFDLGKFREAIAELEPICMRESLEMGDRIMATQFLAHSFNSLGEHPQAIRYAITGLGLDPNRAEYYCMMGEAFMKMNEPMKAIPLFEAAKACPVVNKGTRHEFVYADCYDFFPRANLAQLYFFTGQFEKAIAVLEELKGRLDERLTELSKEINKAIWSTTINPNAIPCDDIVITCPMQTPYPWDEEGYKTKGYGGSETAAIEMAKWLKEKTGRQVKIFQHRESTFVAESGVEYIPAHHLHDYFHKWKPAVHVAWRHCARFTNAPSYVWSHDLFTPGAENIGNYDFILALSDAHKDMLMGMQGIPKEKIIVTRNGINPKRFEEPCFKIPGKVIWPNSLDRGAEYAIQVMDEVRKVIPDAELHMFYGMENMKKSGVPHLLEKVALLEKMISERDWIKYHGNVDQTTLATHMKESEVWLYTANFYETFNITSIEALSAHCWPVVREFGALKNTLRGAFDKGFADVIDIEMDENAIPVFAEKVISALQKKKWQVMQIDPNEYAWERVSEEWVNMLNLNIISEGVV